MTEERAPKTSEELKRQVMGEVGIAQINLEKKPRKLSEIIEEIMPEGTKVKVADIVGQPIVIHSVRLFEGQFGVGAYVIFTDENGELFNTIIGQKILLTKLLAVTEELPVEAVITKHEGGQFGKYYDFE